jgi:Arc/MetJ family transcription regulator
MNLLASPSALHQPPEIPSVYPYTSRCRLTPVTRTNIEIDDLLVDRAMRLYRLRSKREAVDLALRKLVGEPMSREEALAAEGTGWVGDLAEIRSPDEIPER